MTMNNPQPSPEFVSDIQDDPEYCEAVVNRENFERSLMDAQNAWGFSRAGLQAKRAAMTMLATKTGMYARIPLVCKADGCPYSNSCALLGYNLAPLGEPCPMEVAQIEARYAGYDQDFDLDKASFTDKNLVTELIHYDIMLERCKALITEEGTLIQDVVAGIGENGEEFYRPEVSKNWEAYERISKKRDNIYNLMLATRKDRKDKDGDNEDSVSKFMSDMFTADFVVEQKPDNID